MNAQLPTRLPSRWAKFPGLTMDSFEDRMSRLFGEPLWEVEPMGWYPAVDIVESENEMTLTAELPGLAEDDVDIELEGNVLTLKGEKKDEGEREEEKGERKVRIWERRYGNFTRSFTLPNIVDAGKIEAEFGKGVLTIHMPLKKEARGRHIQIKPR